MKFRWCVHTYVKMILFYIALLVSFAVANGDYCSGVAAGDIQLFPNPIDCTSYIRCDGPVLSLVRCPAGLWFSVGINACDISSISGCRAGVQCLPGQTAYFPDPGFCELYYECYLGVISVMQCPAGFYFNAAISQCVEPKDSGCGPYTTPPPWTTPDPSSICYGVPAGSIVLKPDPTDCTKYYICKGLTPTPGTCAPGFAFNEVTSMCDFPSLVPGCDVVTTTTASPGPPDPMCAGLPTPSYLADSNDCQKYFECINDVAYEMDCINGLYFDSITSSCVNLKDSDCGRTTIDPITPTGTPSAICPWPPTNPYDTYPYPGDCTKYILCQGGLPTIMDCPPGLWFDPDTDECNYPYLANC